MTHKTNALSRGVVVFIFLAALTTLEFILARSAAAYIFLWIIAFMKAGLVLWYFMHLRSVFQPGEGGHEE